MKQLHFSKLNLSYMATRSPDELKPCLVTDSTEQTLNREVAVKVLEGCEALELFLQSDTPPVSGVPGCGFRQLEF